MVADLLTDHAQNPIPIRKSPRFPIHRREPSTWKYEHVATAICRLRLRGIGTRVHSFTGSCDQSAQRLTLDSTAVNRLDSIVVDPRVSRQSRTTSQRLPHRQRTNQRDPEQERTQERSTGRERGPWLWLSPCPHGTRSCLELDGWMERRPAKEEFFQQIVASSVTLEGSHSSIQLFVRPFSSRISRSLVGRCPE